MWKTLLAIILVVPIFLSSYTATFAYNLDSRAAQMRTILTKYNSPMIGLENTLIQTAEKYDLDWTILAAIAGTESSFAKRMPANCINPYGWGIYGDHKLCFNSLEAAIEGVASGLASKYNTTSIITIAKTYNSVSTDGWINHTSFFMNKIKSAEIPVELLPVTL
ncbi:MAG: hypothetical protein UX38_C0017G0001 [Microgenomates group bacterium GW2011_GWC1_46_16]|uniref:Mannosyl-glycoprotein endo-beta-N-acetylglucosamidase-like domain-containing protein n=2 Tax=Candidatus Collieribacteriota TaxID=1752725 RepID=A0A1F5FZQ4_9BACT|nr:MAG: hypothetical protein UX32_C0005G0040 [Microgenomates group bacterium GW2011_GWF1_46_12]KKU25739.1 MAG: hypothetical protein UX38_C0017G0001 [Microgenomates group bacterium GW2011_GWC1_46_16]KKU27413.1 MAG: hypothetical protein UX40_C0017G0002 [Microgenomates group bacterium GW2011_GWF2_46_18]KKU43764.1 MAG: hypothetical protein UX59_C0010G0031 [Microgenomates group bacterium GW2011_GWA1_46_7]KKU45428.1 MAG: hypothetical protein UX63_C0006G0041 [Microgenomates group bacterium GW2011_GWB1